MSAPASVPPHVRVIAEAIRTHGAAKRAARLKRQAAAIQALKGKA